MAWGLTPCKTLILGCEDTEIGTDIHPTGVGRMKADRVDLQGRQVIWRRSRPLLPTGPIVVGVPHAVRLVFGPDHRQLLPLSSIVGAIFLVIADTLARIIVAPAQLPVGIVTAILGGPFFLLLLVKYSRKVSWLK